MKIKVKNVNGFSNFITAIMKVVGGIDEGCKFEIDKEKCKVNLITEDQTVRAFFETDVIVSEKDKIEFCFQDLKKLKKSIDLISTIEKTDGCEIDFTGSFLKYQNEVKWKLKTVKDEVIERYISNPLKTKLNSICSFITSSSKIRDVLGNFSIICDEDAKIYIYPENNKVIAEIDNKLEEFTNSVGIPIADKFEGKFEKNICLLQKSFNLFRILDTNVINISYTDKKVVEVNSKVEYENGFISMKLICAILKG